MRRPTSHHLDSLSVDIIRTNNVALNTPENMYNGETKDSGKWQDSIHKLYCNPSRMSEYLRLKECGIS